MSAIALKGMTWSHPRGYDPMIACSALWQQTSRVTIAWDKRSLQDFESFPVEDLARAYDLIVIDHPHVGQITAENCLQPLDVAGRKAEFAELAAASVGPSFLSYLWEGRQWALPIDAAAQVQAWRPDLIAAPAASWAEVMALAREGRVLLPMRPPHSLMTFYTLAANLGRPCATAHGDLIDVETGAEVLGFMRDLVALVDANCFTMDPIAVSEAMAAPGSPIACAPLTYGYVSYAIKGFRPHRLRFADIPPAGHAGPVGSALGGTGIAVSAFSPQREAALDFAFWIAGGAVQGGPYAAAGGQPGHAAAWDSEAVNAPAGDFYRATRRTLEGAWLRPRHRGYMEFQQAASDRINAALQERHDLRRTVEDLNQLFEASFAASTSRGSG